MATAPAKPAATASTKPTTPTTNTKPASTTNVANKPATTTNNKPATTASVKPAATATTTTSAAPASAAASARAREDAALAAARAKTLENSRQKDKEIEAIRAKQIAINRGADAKAGTQPATTSTGTPTQMDKARNRIQSELPADGAVRADPGNKPSAAGVQASEFKPKVRTKPSAEPPAPGQPNFPKRPADQPALTNPLSR